MEDQGKRLILAVGVIAAMYLIWTLFFVPKAPPRPAQQPAPAQTATSSSATPESQPSTAAAGSPAGSAPESQPAAAAGVAPATAPAAQAECKPETEGAPTWDTPRWTAVFSRCGGALASFRLKGKQYDLDLVRTGGDPALYPLQVQVEAPASGGANPDEKRVPVIAAKAEWELVPPQSDKELAFRWKSPDGALLVTKTYKRLDAKYAFGLDVEVKNISEKPNDKRIVAAEVVVYGWQDPNAPSASWIRYAEPPWGASCYVDGKNRNHSLKDLRSEARVMSGDVRWGGFEHQYFLLAAAPLDKEAVAMACGETVASDAGAMRTTLAYTTPVTLDPNQSLQKSLVVYAGPKILEELEDVARVVGKDIKLEGAVDLGWFGFLARPMLWLLKFFYSVLANWGIAIILLTIAVKLATLYWTTKSMRSMKGMSKLKPEMDRIRAQYANDKQRMNLEMMNLYKRNNISPFGGCLPMLLQMPIWIALYQTLRSAAELYHAPFAGWIHDLTAPDPLHIIPIALTILMFVQARIQPAAVDSQQQKIMQYMMPAMFGFMSLVFPSGLAVYMFTNSVLTMAHQFYMNHTDKKTPAPVVAGAAAAAPAATSGPGSGSGSGPAAKKGGKGGGRKKMAKA